MAYELGEGRNFQSCTSPTTIHFNLDGFDLNKHKEYLAKRNSFFETRPQLKENSKDLQLWDMDSGGITSWEYGTLVGNDNLFYKTIFYAKDGAIIPHDQISRIAL
ncbi:MAG: hypothetical protein HC857_02200 [Synechococcales cyanobacterium RU_4_20]|nr:hypothetical protein [Synechococcales cyanobacterium RU_4_20]